MAIIRTTSASLNVTVNLTPTPLRVASPKVIDLMNLLPVHLEFSETGEFVEFFETYLNELYDEYVSYRDPDEKFTVDINGTKSYYKTSADSNGDAIMVDSGYPDTAQVPYTYPVNPTPKISILEKVNRITDTHDPDLIDIEYINQLANLMGYDVGVVRSDVESINNSSNDYDTQRYLRFIVSNLPSWYRIKGTRNSVKTLLYSFGLVGDIVYKWTSDNLGSTSDSPDTGGYGNDLDLWVSEDTGITSAANPINIVPEHYFPTPHFKIIVNQDTVDTLYIANISKIANALEDIRPINTVLDAVSVLFRMQLETVPVRMEEQSRTILFVPQTQVMNSIITNNIDLIVEDMQGNNFYIEDMLGNNIVLETL